MKITMLEQKNVDLQKKVDEQAATIEAFQQFVLKHNRVKENNAKLDECNELVDIIQDKDEADRKAGIYRV